ncbi:MAG: 1-deoxy-D-xylulose-5-phosphate reductoisomerase [Ignavibacteriales bacterium]|nr:1-deoxy-D-xylulose-5-phosphate reductoisomerase [Ignavibacteriales bacterium]
MPSALRNIAILGATGSIGRNSLQVIKTLSDRFRATYLVVHRNIDGLMSLITEHHPKGVAVLDESCADVLRKKAGNTVEVLGGMKGVKELVGRDDVDLVISALVGFAGLEPTLEAIRKGKTIALANKETLVAGGELITKLLQEHGTPLIPIDSEHSAILQCLVGEEHSAVARLILTASGGPFLTTPIENLVSVTVEQALNHPNWKMGNKITIDSATLMNKGLEVIEAHWLFHLPPAQIDVVIHPQSIIHSMVEFVDGSVKAQLGLPDMKLPIQYALTYPNRTPMNGARVDFPGLKSMTFFEPDRRKFRCLELAYGALELGGTAPAVLNAANEVAVEAFLQRKIPFQKIPDLIGKALDAHSPGPVSDLDHILEADRSARMRVTSLL